MITSNLIYLCHVWQGCRRVEWKSGFFVLYLDLKNYFDGLTFFRFVYPRLGQMSNMHSNPEKKTVVMDELNLSSMVTLVPKNSK